MSFQHKQQFNFDSPTQDYPPSPDQMGYQDKQLPQSSKLDQFGLLGAIFGVAFMVIYTWILIYSNNPSSMKWFAVHPPFQTLAVGIFIMGILTLQPTSLAQPKLKARGLSRHQILMFGLGFPIIFFGTVAIIWNKFDHESSHFTTWHATLGIISVTWMLLQLAVGAASVWFGGRAFGKNPKAVYKYHRASGYGLLIVFLLTIHIGGAWSHFSTTNSHVALRVLAYAVAPIAIILGVYSRVRLNKIQLF